MDFLKLDFGNLISGVAKMDGKWAPASFSGNIFLGGNPAVRKSGAIQMSFILYQIWSLEVPWMEIQGWFTYILPTLP